jgi:Big-like domain-containing protein
MIKLLALLAAVLAAAAAVQGTGASFTASSANNGSSFATAAKFAPAVAVTAPADGSATNDTTPTITGTAGTATSDSTTVSVKIYSGTSATGTPVQTKSATRNASGAWSVNASTLAQGTYTVQATQTDTAGNTGTSAANTFKVDTTKPTAVRLVAANGGGGTAGKLNAGDTVTFTYSEAISPSSVLTGWDGSSTSVQIRFTNGSTDSFSVLSTNLGSVATNGNYVTSTVTFSATMTRSADGASMVITLGTPSGVQTTPVTAKAMTWTFTAAVKDLAGNTISAGSWTESDGDVDF